MELEGLPGLLIERVNLVPLDPNNYADKKLFYRIVKSDSKKVYAPLNDDKSANIAKAMDRYRKLKERNSNEIKKLMPEMDFENADKPEKQ